VADAPVPVESPDGTPGYVPKAEVRQVVEAGGRVLSPDEARATQHQIDIDEQTDLTRHPEAAIGAAGALAAGAARGASFGLSDVLASGLSDAARSKLNEWRELHPTASMLGELGGTAASFAYGGELGAGLRAESAVGRVAQSAARGAAEMSLYEGGRAAGDAALANEPITGEKIVAGMGHGALMGALAGGALSTVAEGLGAAGRALRAPRAAEAAEGASEGGGPRLGDRLQQMADESRVRGMGGTLNDVKTINRTVKGGVSKVAQDVEPVIRGAEDHAARLKRVEEAIDKGVEKQKDLLSALDKAKTGIAPDAESFVQAARKEVLGRYVVNGEIAPGGDHVVNTVEKFLGQVEKAGSREAPTFEQWHQWRTNLDKLAKFEKRNFTPAEGAMQQLRGMMEEHLRAAGEEAAQSMGSSFRAEWQANQGTLQSLYSAEKLLERGAAASTKNNVFGLRSTIAGAAGSVVGGMVGGPVGSLVGAGAASLAGKLVESRGDMLAADLLDRAAGILGARRIAARTDATMIRGVRDLVGKAANDNADRHVLDVLAPPARASLAPMGITLTGDKRKDYASISNHLTASAGDPVRTTDRLSRALGDLPQHAPKAAQSVIDTTLKGSSFLLSKLPPSRKDPYSLQPQLEKGSRASDSEISKFMHYAEGVDDPMIVLREAKAGTLTRDHVEAVKSVYPNLYDEMRQQVMRALVDTKAELPYERRIQLGILLDIPTDKTLAPDFLRAIQATYSSAEKAGAETPPPTLSRPINVANTLQTATQTAQREGLER
jgi:hypothetical protein